MALIKVAENPEKKKTPVQKMVPIMRPSDRSKPSTFGLELNKIAATASIDILSDTNTPRRFENGEKTFKETKNSSEDVIAE